MEEASPGSEAHNPERSGRFHPGTSETGQQSGPGHVHVGAAHTMLADGESIRLRRRAQWLPAAATSWRFPASGALRARVRDARSSLSQPFTVRKASSARLGPLDSARPTSHEHSPCPASPRWRGFRCWCDPSRVRKDASDSPTEAPASHIPRYRADASRRCVVESAREVLSLVCRI